MKLWHIGLVLVLMIGVLAGCGGDASPADDAPAAADNPAEEEQETIVQTGSESKDSESDAGAVPGVSDELPVGNRLVLGTFMLEGTENAVTPAQAKTLLPLWQAIQGGSLQGQAETDAVLKQIEGAMTAGQMAAIDAMQLTGEDMGTWMLEQGVNFRPPRGAEGGFGDMTEEERAEMRATRQAGGGIGEGGFGQGGFADMSEEEREAKRATAEAGGFGGGLLGSAGRGPGQLTFLATPLVELLTARAAE
jgi:hypothetical protein